jgi:UDP-glucose 4-epimerase
MRRLVIGACGFIGGNLSSTIAREYPKDQLRIFDRKIPDSFGQKLKPVEAEAIEGDFNRDYDFDSLVRGCEEVYHLISTTVPSSDILLEDEIAQNVFPTLALLDACVRHQVKRVIFISSGGTVYGKSEGVPFKESDENEPICSYGIQKLIIEKYLYLYKHLYQLDYRIVRLSNPYGPGQNPFGNVGAVTAFTKRILDDEVITLYGDGENVRDYIYIDDAVKGILNIASSADESNVFNLGSGIGYSLNEVISIIEEITNRRARIHMEPSRSRDLQYSVLNITKYKQKFPKHKMVSLKKGISMLIEYWEK